jgi:branched-chain amino acid transport system permease protein
MGFGSFMQTILFGIFAGSIYGVAAMGLALVFGVMKILNIAHGELVMIGGYVGFWAFATLGVDPFASLILVIVALFVLGLILDRLVYRHVVKLQGEEKIKNSLLVSFGLGLVLQNLALQIFTGDERSVQVSYAGKGFDIYGVLLPYTRLGTVAIVLIITLALHFFLRKTYPGKAILATAEDYESAGLAGININRVYMMTFALGAALAGVAGQFVTFTYALSPSIGMFWTLKAMIVIVLAGTGSILGALPAGILLGVVEALSGAYLAQTYKEVVGLIIFLLVLILRPQGLFVRK